MATLAFDTLKAARRLGEAGFSAEQAEAIVGTMADSVTENLATKDDLKLLEQSLEARIDGVEQSLEAKIDGVEQRLEAKIDGLGKTMTIRLGGLVIAGFTFVAILDRIWAT